MEENLRIEYVLIDSIRPNERNAKDHPRSQIEQMKESIRKFGFRDPIGVWKNVIVEGHGRHIAAKELGLTHVPVIRLDDMTDEQRREYALVHNKMEELSTWNFEKLDAELKDLDKNLMSNFGFELSFDADFGESFNQQRATEETTSGNEAVYGGAPVYGSYDTDDAKGDDLPLSKEELKQYEDSADEYLARKRIIITYDAGDEKALAEKLGIEEIDKVVYPFEELKK